MKTRLLLPVVLVILSLVPALGQQGVIVPALAVPHPQETPILTKFSLDFHGGTPDQLVTAIEKATGKPFNVIIPAEHADFKLPPLKMNNVNVAQLFLALEATSRKSESYNPPGQGYTQQLSTSYGFRTPNMNWASDDSIWYFYVEKPPTPLQVTPAVQKVCKFYPLTLYLERGLTVDDITTAIQTGWKMLGEKGTPTISFHKETKLLIAVGEPAKLETIDAVLRALAPMATPGGTFEQRLNTMIQTPQNITVAPPRPATPKPTEKPKTEN